MSFLCFRWLYSLKIIIFGDVRSVIMKPCSKVLKPVASVVLAAALSGCTGSGNKASETKIEAIEIVHDEAAALFEGSTDSLNINMKIEWPVGGVDEKVLERMQRDITAHLLGEEYHTFDIDYAIRQYCDRSIEFYRETNSEWAESEGFEEDMHYTLQWMGYIEGGFLPEYRNMISYVTLYGGYSGGAHGMDAKAAITFDIDTGKRVTEADLFKPGYEDRLTQSLRANLLLSVEDVDMLFETEIDPNGNFYVSDEGVTYIYGRYEVGPYVLGIVEVNIPWDEISDILK